MQIVEAPDGSVERIPGFDVTHYLRRLKQVSVEMQRIRSDPDPEMTARKNGSMRELAGLVKQGMTQAKSGVPSRYRNAFVDQMRKIVASSGVPIPGIPAKADDPAVADAAPASVAGVAGTGKAPGGDTMTARDPADMFFPDRLPRFIKQWEAGDPAWRLLQCASKAVDDKIYIIGVAETSQQVYTVFHGLSGGSYKTTEMPLVKAQNMMSTAFQRGYTSIPPKALAAKVGLNHVVNTQYQSDSQKLARRDGGVAPPPMDWNTHRQR